MSGLWHVTTLSEQHNQRILAARELLSPTNVT